ncbi:MAG: ATP:cob(I)alamin adenosyltransferase [Acidocella sp. 20-57-95]|nr:MAG: ATP:cob(I)alamin adenosyltransferase [Acidocella sp. 20-57-95]OYV58365.1 MAG: ATP:cob(I)alamin adenosyltransferase [Acidocella sp. 21-58-7]HQT64928.1 cob(I)yrinic acid a,c-diamide adenosyltransferase [Acidocella sp.]HQU05009.1 cob(I)yrinic acid a,c-diamide adenosyltransferase [Acidocella sp.]
MVKLDKIYTRGGDAGETSLGNGARVAKCSARVASYGDVDEANAVLGIVRLHVNGADDAVLARIQNDLFDVGADLCVPIEEAPKYPPLRVTQAQVDWLEGQIDRMNAELAPLRSFVVPGGSPAAAYLHQARTVVRRAERELVRLLGEPDEAVNRLVLVYLNRLSDLLFVMSRYVNDKGARDVLWVPAANRDG